MPRFVLLYHDCPAEFGKPSHWDLMLERDGALATWTLPELPAAWQKEAGPRATACESLPMAKLPDHRLDYLDYEGPLTNHRGHVSRHDGGEYRILADALDRLEIELNGQCVRGRAVLRRNKGDAWLLEVDRRPW